jgi:hypothetical protein
MVAAGLFVLLAVAPALAETFGTAATVSHTVPAFLFTPNSYSYPDRYETTTTGARHCLGVDCVLSAAVQLPAGALVTSIEVDGCDTDGLANLRMKLKRGALHAGVATDLAEAVSSGAPGCGFITATLATPETIDNRNHTYWLEFFGITPGPTLQFQAVRIFYTLQVSPAPATATFGDVPTSHAFFRFVEALVASGITAGCGGGNYCPDAPLTRGQMAVFLSKALGLHFAP